MLFRSKTKQNVHIQSHRINPDPQINLAPRLLDLQPLPLPHAPCQRDQQPLHHPPTTSSPRTSSHYILDTPVCTVVYHEQSQNLGHIFTHQHLLQVEVITVHPILKPNSKPFVSFQSQNNVVLVCVSSRIFETRRWSLQHLLSKSFNLQWTWYSRR